MKVPLPLSLSQREVPETDEPAKSTRNSFHIEPGYLLLLAIAIGIALFISSLYFHTRGPWFGVELVSHQKGFEVKTVATGGPSEGKLVPGDVLIALNEKEGVSRHLDGGLLIESPLFLPTYSSYNKFIASYQDLYSAIGNDSVTFVLDNGREVVIEPGTTRPLTALGWVYWVLTMVGILVFWVGVGVWGFRPGQATARIVVLSATGYMLAALAFAVMESRDGLLNPQLLWLGSHLVHLGDMLYGYTAMVLFWYFPRCLGRFPMVSLFLSAIALLLLNEYMEFIEWPIHTFDMQYVIPFILGIIFASIQWKINRDDPVQHAALRWIFHSTLLSISLIMLFYVVPILHNSKALFPYWSGQLLAVGLYVGIILGVLRYRLFDLDLWWFSIWSWVIGGAVIVLVDMLVAYYTRLGSTGALTVSMLVVGWLYFPLRQWLLWNWGVRSHSQRIDDHLLSLLDTFFAVEGNDTLSKRWQRLLRQVFDPLNVCTVERGLAETRIEENGIVLAVPDVGADRRILLTGRSRGSRLFNRDDIKLMSLVHTLARKSTEIKSAQEKGAVLERERIARDLHDDVAPQLLSLVHLADSQENAQRARAAMRTLRESIYTLSEPEGLPLETVVTGWRVEVSERAEAAKVKLSWHQPSSTPQLTCSARQNINLTRVLREIVTNALHHAEPDSIAIKVAFTAREMHLSLSHNGHITPPSTWRAGKGLNNIKTRIAELGGQVTWKIESDVPLQLTFDWQVPLSMPRG